MSISCGSNGDIYPKGTQTLPVPVDLTVTATPDPGYKVHDWYVDGLPTGALGINQNGFHWLGAEPQHTIYVPFIRITNRVSTIVGTGGTLVPNGTLWVGWGDSVTFTATPEPHYHVDTWKVDNEVAQTNGNTFVLPNVQTEHGVRVSFAVEVYNVQATANLHGTLSPTGTVAVTYGANRQFFATPEAGYDRVVWLLDGNPVLPNALSYVLYGVQTNHVLHVSFISPELSIALSPTNSVLLSWPEAMNLHTLQETASLRPMAWSNSTAKVSRLSDRRQANVAPTVGPRFYRLSYP